MPFLLSAKDAWLKYFLDCSSVCRALGWEEGVSVQAPGVVTRDLGAREQGYDPLYAHIASRDEVWTRTGVYPAFIRTHLGSCTLFLTQTRRKTVVERRIGTFSPLFIKSINYAWHGNKSVCYVNEKLYVFLSEKLQWGCQHCSSSWPGADLKWNIPRIPSWDI